MSANPAWLLPFTLDVSDAQKQLEADVWNRHDLRRNAYVHKAVDDIWVRYNAWENFDGDASKFNAEHASVWYPVVSEIPAIWSIVRKVRRYVSGELGGVLITRIPAGGKVESHIDHGWHATAHRKIAVQIKGDLKQSFNWDGFSLSAVDGEVYEFENDVLHWVNNDSERERITLIICIRK